MKEADSKKNILIIIQGMDLVKECEMSESVKHFIQNNYPKTKTTGTILVKEFETEAELNAYWQGVEDAEGWNENYVVSDKEAEEVFDFLETTRVYVVREHFFQEDMEEDYRFILFAGVKSYERAISFLTETANAQDTFLEFLEKEKDDFKERNLYWEIEEQTLEMWSAESIELLDSVKELGNYAEKYGDLNYEVVEVDYGITAYSFEKH
ncbi:MAG: hypothetical protein ACR2MD_08030 [Aridibacter sp.]